MNEKKCLKNYTFLFDHKFKIDKIEKKMRWSIS